ncbi:MAG: hypothetical protein BAJATHORv1_20330 [Candidatus Thorarchaeota archaeon]|nr:MAG: hypothetical protein BAJATHORv1_20330 [Candidatus Thorarchaeota archaeon]
MLTLEETIEIILKQLPEYDRKDIVKMIQEKREELGPEVVNEESAAMIVARELGIDTHQLSSKARLRIEDISESTRSVTLTAKVVRVTPVRTFSRSDGEEGKVASIIIADETGSMRVALWDDKTAAVSEGAIDAGSVIQIRGAYVKKGLRDALELNLGRMGGIKLLDDYEMEDLDIDLTKREPNKISELKEREYDITILGQVQRVFNLSTFTRKSDGKEGKVLSMVVADETGSARLVFWDDFAEEMQSVKEGEIIRLTGGYTRAGRSGDVEVHAGKSAKIDRNLDVDLDVAEAAPPMTSSSESLGRKNISDLETGMWDVDIEGKVVRIFDMTTFERDGSEGRVQNIIIADETGTIRVTFWNDDVDEIKEIEEGDIIRILHGYVKEGFRGGYEYQVGRKAEIQINPKDASVTDLDISQVSTRPTISANRYMIGDIDNSTEGKTVEICGIIVNISQMRPVYPACPSCRKKLNYEEGKYNCEVCGDVKKPEYRMLFKITVDDGSGSIRATLFGESGEELLGISAEEAQRIIEKTGRDNAPIEQNADRALGRYVSIQGRISKYRDSLDLSTSKLEFADPIEEIKRVRKDITSIQ